MPRRRLLAIGWREVVAILSTAAMVGACGIAAQSPGSGATSTPGGTQATTGTPAATATYAATATTGASPTATSGATATASAGATPTAAGSPTAQPTLANQVDWDNWPLYIDTEATANTRCSTSSPEETGITVNYHEDINDNSEFFGKIQPDLAAERLDRLRRDHAVRLDGRQADPTRLPAAARQVAAAQLHGQCDRTCSRTRGTTRATSIQLPGSRASWASATTPS